jgi:hypothetical protein
MSDNNEILDYWFQISNSARSLESQASDIDRSPDSASVGSLLSFVGSHRR